MANSGVNVLFRWIDDPTGEAIRTLRMPPPRVGDHVSLSGEDVAKVIRVVWVEETAGVVVFIRREQLYGEIMRGDSAVGSAWDV